MATRVRGHTDSVLCCEVLPTKKLLVSGGEDGRLCFTDLATLQNVGAVKQAHGDSVPSVCAHPAEEHSVFAAAGSSVLELDLRKGLGGEAPVRRTFSENAEEVNCVAASAASGGWVAAADDGGEVVLLGLGPTPTKKTLRRGHNNICSAVAFRQHRPWEVLSGGLDAAIVRWDFSRLRPLQTWNLCSEAAAAQGQVFNPPMVHALAVPQTEDRMACRLMAVARGDGAVAVYDADHQPAASPRARSSGGGGGSSSSNKGSGGSKGRQKGSSSSSSAAGGQPAAGDVPGWHCLLGPEQGGHTAAVSCVAFMPGWQQLASGGNDGRVVLWNWMEQAEVDVATAQAAAEHQEAAAAAAPPSPSGLALPAPAEGAGGALVAADMRHGRKVNWVCCSDALGSPTLYIADTSRLITALPLPG